MTDQEKAELMQKIRALEWTEIVDPNHGWYRCITVRKSDVIEETRKL